MKKEIFSIQQSTQFDYKDTETLKKFLSPYGKIQPRRRSGLSAAGQRALATAIKRARFMALLPFVIK